MKLENPYTLVLKGDPAFFATQAPRSRETLHYLLDRLFSGKEVAVEELLSWGLSVELVDEFVKVPRLD